MTDQVTRRQVNFAYLSDQRITQAFSGEWKVVKTPVWVQYTRGSGDVFDLSLRAVRGNADFQALTQPSLTGEIVIAWKSKENGQSGQTSWPVSLNMYQVSGTTAPHQTSGPDARSETWTPPAAQSSTQDYIVTYKTRAARDTGVLAYTRQALRAAPSVLSIQVSAAPPADPLGARSAMVHGLSQADVGATRRDPDVLSVEPNAELHLQSNEMSPLQAPLEPSDQYYPNQWAMRLLGYPAVWRDMATTPYQHPVVVAVLDTGVRYDHPDLAGVLLRGVDGAIDLIPREKSDDDNGVDSDPTDPSFLGRTMGSHGTHVAGIIAARWGTFTPPCAGCSSSGVVGASYTAPVKILPIRIIDATGTTTIAETVNGIRYAAGLPITVGGSTFTNSTPAQILNLSLGSLMSAETAAPLCDAIAEVRKKGVLAFVAAGNFGTSTVNYPAGCPDAVAVASVTLSKSGAPEHSSFSSAYPQVQLSAPGGAGSSSAAFNGSLLNGTPFPDDIMSTNWDYSKNLPNYSGMSGTSQATPQVAALAALMLSKGVTTNAEDTLARLDATATDLGQPGRDNQFGYGMIDPVAALGAPAISAHEGIQVYADDGHTYGALMNGNTFVSYLPEGSYTLVYGTDTNGNSTYGEKGEAHTAKRFVLGLENPDVKLGFLNH
ncbi:S8 family serine peptidase [Deinococcus detaillensis]|uniref:S8 family serine peptidase n=1 Tax=Deinococcus detaillensis TaxID=2592048 RepID=UPI00163D4395|nr:S8 family serine peptidase [Deinococcus detaillensis]